MYDVPITTTGHASACGPASLRMLLAYYGTDGSLEDLIAACGVRVNGCTGADLLRVGRAHGLDMIAYQMDAAELLRQDRPAIIWWRYGHWVVFCGIKDGDPVICNPGRGRYRIDADTFGTLYSGVSLFNGEPADLPEPVPADMLAREDIPKGARFILHDTIYVALEAIPRGAEIRPLRNCAPTSLDEILSANG